MSKRVSAKGSKIKKAVTLIEVIVIVIIIGIIVSLAISHFGPAKEEIVDREAISNLKVIRVAEKSYYIDAASNYYPSSESVSDIVAINQNLKLSLPVGSQRNWNYTVWSTGCARATRNGGDGRSWYFKIDDDGSDTTDCTKDGEPNKNSCYTCL